MNRKATRSSRSSALGEEKEVHLFFISVICISSYIKQALVYKRMFLETCLMWGSHGDWQFLKKCHLSLSRQLSLFIFADSNKGTERLESSLAEFSRSETWALVFSFIFCLDHCPPRHYQDPKWLEDWFRVSSKPSSVVCSSCLLLYFLIPK